MCSALVPGPEVEAPKPAWEDGAQTGSAKAKAKADEVGQPGGAATDDVDRASFAPTLMRCALGSILPCDWDFVSSVDY